MPIEDYFMKLERPRALSDVAIEPGISLSPGMVMAREIGGKKLRITEVNSETLFMEACLNPVILDKQGLQSRIGPGENVEYELPNKGKVTIGFYDRKNAMKQGKITDVYRAFQAVVEGMDSEFPKIPIMERNITSATLEGSNFPQMFNYRSVLFPNDKPTKFGIAISCDKLALGQPEEREFIITKEFALEHPEEMTYLTGLIFEAARENHIPEANLTFIDAFGADRIKAFLTKGYDVKISYKMSPHLTAVARLNGVPLNVEIDGDDISEFMVSGATNGIDSALLYSKSIVKDAKSDNAKAGDMVYKPIPREVSVYLAQAAAENELPFGTMEIQVMRALNLDDIIITFQKKDQILFPEDDIPGSRRSGSGDQFYLGAQPSTDKKYTAGSAGVEEIKPVHIKTKRTYFGGMLVHDIFCLVHEDTGKGMQIPYD